MTQQQEASRPAAAGADQQSSDSTSGGSKGRSGYLAALPEGWHYAIAIHGPGEARVDVRAHEGENVRVTFRSGADDKPRVVNADTLREGMQAANKGVKTLDKVAKSEDAARRAREDAMGVLGNEADDDEPDEAH